jgi:hypothetical protein
MRRIEVRLRGGRAGADEPIVIVRCDVRVEHVLPSILVAAVADEALLIAVVDCRNAAQR